MDRLLQIAKIACLAAVVFVCIAIGIAALSIRQDVRNALNSVTADVHNSTQKVNSAVDQVSDTTKRIGDNADRLTTRADRVLIIASATAREAHLAAKYQRKFWETETPQIARKTNTLLDNGNKVMLGLADTNKHLREDLDQLTKESTDTLEEAQTSIRSFNFILTSPDIPTITKNLARVSAGAAQMSEDSAYKLHKVTHPETQSRKARALRFFMTAAGVTKDTLEIRYYWLKQ